MKKKLLSVSVLLLLLVSFIPSMTKADKPIKLIIDGKEVQTDVAPFLENGRTLVPVRVISESLGYKVSWSEEDSSVSIMKINSANNSIEKVLGLEIGQPFIIEFDIPTINKVNQMLNNKTITVEKSGEMLAETAIKHNLDVAPKTVNSRTFVPIRAISETMGLNVRWDENAWVVNITSTNIQTDVEVKIETNLNVKENNEKFQYDIKNMESLEELSKEKFEVIIETPSTNNNLDGFGW